MDLSGGNYVCLLVLEKCHNFQVTDKFFIYLYFSSDGINKPDVFNIRLSVESIENLGYLANIPVSEILEKISMQCCIPTESCHFNIYTVGLPAMFY